jgi:hypothetical protein
MRGPGRFRPAHACTTRPKRAAVLRNKSYDGAGLERHDDGGGDDGGERHGDDGEAEPLPLLRMHKALPLPR